MTKQNDIFSYYKKELTDKVLREIKDILNINILEQNVSLVKASIADEDINEYMDLEITHQKSLIKSAIEYASSPKNIDKTIKAALAHYEQNIKDLNSDRRNLGSVIEKRQSKSVLSKVINFFDK